jgi:hypothetical protein
MSINIGPMFCVHLALLDCDFQMTWAMCTVKSVHWDLPQNVSGSATRITHGDWPPEVVHWAPRGWGSPFTAVVKSPSLVNVHFCIHKQII